jgi:hypothetical protein
MSTTPGNKPDKLELATDKLVKEADEIIVKVLEARRASLKSDLENAIDKGLQVILAKYLGFDNRYGRWELDHCNGRSGNTAAGNFVKAEIQKVCPDYLKKQVGDLPDLPKETIEDLKKHYLKRLESEVKQALNDFAVKEGRKIAKQLMDDVG